MNHSRLLALFTVCFVIGIGLAAGATFAVANWNVTERYHPALCYRAAISNGQVWMMGLPCKYLTNHPFDV